MSSDTRNTPLDESDTWNAPLDEKEQKRFLELQQQLEMGVTLKPDQIVAYDEWLGREIHQRKAAVPLKTMRQVALLHIFQGWLFPHNKAQAIAAKYGFISPNSGQSMYAKFNRLDKGSNERTGVAKRGINSMIKDIKAVIPHLDVANRQQANNELQALIDEKNKPV